MTRQCLLLFSYDKKYPNKEDVMDELFNDLLKQMDKEDLIHLEEKVSKNSRWKFYISKYLKFGFKDHLQLSAFWTWYKNEKKGKEDKESKDEKKSTKENQLLHNLPYWYDKERDVYVVHIPTKKKPFALQGAFWREIKEAYSNWDGGASSINEICRKFALSRNTVISLLKAMGVTHDSSPWSDEHTHETMEDTLIEDLLRRKEESVLVKAQKLEWDSIKKDARKYRIMQLYTKSIRSTFDSFKPKHYAIPKIDLKRPFTPYSLIVSPTDFHWGKYAPKYTGDEYNRTIARERLFELSSDLINRIKDRGRPDCIYLALGGDGLHIDNQGRTTTRGTPQDCDGTPSELAATYVSLCREYIDFLNQVAPIKVFVIPGNHDYYTSTLLREALKGWFNSNDEVSVVDNISPRQSFSYGNSLITFMHGDEGSVKDYPAIIASENSKDWGKSKWRFIFTGHLHTERELPTFGNITVYRMPSLAGTDDWHYRKGYKSRKALIGYIIDPEEGVVSTEICPVKNPSD